MTERFIAQREFAVQPEALFAAWTEVSILSRWFGCGDDTLWTVHEWDVREGGAILVSLDFDGKPFEVHGEFLIVDPPRRLSYRWDADQTVNVTIERSGNGSLLTLEHQWPPTNEDRSMLDAGWKNALEQLRHLVEDAVAP
ncbi:MAG: SRPBCC domain-containing protein [Candidatus Eremiobacteraeota bacterium]|nr:SRPBCC domain-containing protein [Candidatus Eremiobacteraeota bacterium]